MSINGADATVVRSINKKYTAYFTGENNHVKGKFGHAGLRYVASDVAVPSVSRNARRSSKWRREISSIRRDGGFRIGF